MNTTTWTQVQKTLLIPLIGRALAQKQYPKLDFRDVIAEELVSQIDLKDYQGISQDRNSVWGSIVRTKVFDKQVSDFLKSENKIQIINIGCGFCTRVWRLRDDLKLDTKWIEWDFPEIIKLKKQYFPEHPNVKYCDDNIYESFTLLYLINDKSYKTIIVMEGVLMFFPEEKALRFLESLSPNVYLLTDYISPPILKISHIHPSLKDTKATYSFAMGPIKKIKYQAQVVEENLFSNMYTGWLKFLNAILSVLFQGPLYDVVLLKIQDK